MNLYIGFQASTCYAVITVCPGCVNVVLALFVDFGTKKNYIDGGRACFKVPVFLHI